jgi:hypothetical protein
MCSFPRLEVSFVQKSRNGTLVVPRSLYLTAHQLIRKSAADIMESIEPHIES